MIKASRDLAPSLIINNERVLGLESEDITRPANLLNVLIGDKLMLGMMTAAFVAAAFTASTGFMAAAFMATAAFAFTKRAAHRFACVGFGVVNWPLA